MNEGLSMSWRNTEILAFAKLPLSFNQDKLKDDLAKLETLEWHLHVNRHGYVGSWHSLALHVPKTHKNSHLILQNFAIESVSDWVRLPVLDTLPCISSILEQFRCPLNSVRLLRLDPQSEILPHRDLGLSIEHGEARIHIPLQISQGVEFMINNRRISMRLGEAWYMNADLVHSVINKSDFSRINLVVDCVVNDWLLELVDSSADIVQSKLQHS